MRALLSRFLTGGSLIASCLLVAGCSTINPRGSRRDSDVQEFPESWKPNLLYLLFYNDNLCKDSGTAAVGPAGASNAPSPRPKVAKPYADVLPYPAIYFNTRYFPWFPWRFSGMDKKCLLHEAGHTLGLVRRPT